LMPAALAWGWLTIFSLAIFSFPLIFIQALRFHPTILHCRSIGAGLLGLWIGKVLKLPTVFDPRGHYSMSRQDRYDVADRFEALRIPDEDYELAAVAPREAQEYLRKVSFGLAVVNKANIWPVKFAEYLAAGLPIVLTIQAGKHLIDIVEKKKLGVCVDLNRAESYAGIVEVLSNLEVYSERCRAYAEHRLGIISTARQHVRLYKQLGTFH